MDEEADILRIRAPSICVGHEMQTCPGTGGEESMAKTRQRLAIKAPVLLLGSSQLLLFFLRIICPECPVLQRCAGPDTSQAREAETELEAAPREAGYKRHQGRALPLNRLGRHPGSTVLCDGCACIRVSWWRQYGSVAKIKA